MHSQMGTVSACRHVWLVCVAGAFLLISLTAPGETPAAKPGWSWPTSASDLAVRGEILRQKYTEEEQRNIQTVLEDLTGVGRAVDPERWRSKDAKPSARAGFYVLDEAFGHNDYRIGSFTNRVNTVEEVFAKGNRVIAQWRITGNIDGPMFSFQGLGQPIDLREMMIFEFDSDGKVVRSAPWSGEDIRFYEQLGGPLSLPGAWTEPARPPDAR